MAICVEFCLELAHFSRKWLQSILMASQDICLEKKIFYKSQAKIGEMGDLRLVWVTYICSDYFAITCWVLSVWSEIKEDVAERLDGNTRMVTERVVTKLCASPNPNPKTSEASLKIFLDMFWKEFKHFQNKISSYEYLPGRFLTPDALNINSYVWYHLCYALGFVVCHATSTG